MIKPIVLYGKRILRQQATPYEVNSDVTGIIRDLWDTMNNAGGAGLAAPQINVDKRIFVVDVPYTDYKKVFINSQILEYSGKDMELDEGCLSLPGLNAPIIRKGDIKMEWYDENWKYHIEDLRGLISRVVQHEYDHLEGRLWIDRIDPALGMKMMDELKNIYDRNVEVAYPII